VAIIDVKGPFPTRRAGKVLRERIVESLIAKRPRPGERLPTTEELVRRTGLSPATVTRALGRLQREGWIERHAGKGTFVGPRARLPVVPRAPRMEGARRLLRVMVMTDDTGPSPGWFNMPLLEGIEEASVHEGLSIELLAVRRDDVATLRKRLAQSRPDGLIAFSPRDQMHYVIGDAEAMGVPVVVVGLHRPGIGDANVCEDGAQGMGLAVRHLAGLGHRRIGFLGTEWADYFTFERRRGWERAMREAGLDADEGLAHWLPRERQSELELAVAVDSWLRRQRITAVVCSMALAAAPLWYLVDHGRLAIPRELSVVVFDQAPESGGRLGLSVTHVAQPLSEEGTLAAEMIRRLVEGKTVESLVGLPCRLVEGETTGPRENEVEY
jgi:LacI family transcriptional regulator